MAKYVTRQEAVNAVQWQPLPEFGEWKSGRLVNYFRSIMTGVGSDGVTYSSAGTYIVTRCASLPIAPGDWIVRYEDGRVEVHSAIAFPNRFCEVSHAEEPGTIQGPAN